MQVEAKIDFQHHDTISHQVGDNIGDCNGVITGTGDQDGLLATVNPDPKVCAGCSLCDYCTQSNAD